MNRSQSSPESAPKLWILTADQRVARLLTANWTEHGRLHVHEKTHVEEQWEDLQHDRPSPRSGKGGHTAASLGRENEERLHRFAKQVGRWTANEIRQRDIPTLHAFCAPRFLGELRNTFTKQQHEQLVDHALDLAHLTPGELGKHEALIKVAEQLKSDPDSMNASDCERENALAVALEHAALNKATHSIQTELDRLRHAPIREPEGALLSTQLKSLRFHLTRHFELEERGGILRKRDDLDEERERLVKLLLGEHRDFERRLDHLLTFVEDAEQPGSPMTVVFLEGMDSLLQDLKKHESAENAIMRALTIHSGNAAT